MIRYVVLWDNTAYFDVKLEASLHMVSSKRTSTFNLWDMIGILGVF